MVLHLNALPSYKNRPRYVDEISILIFTLIPYMIMSIPVLILGKYYKTALIISCFLAILQFIAIICYFKQVFLFKKNRTN